MSFVKLFLKTLLVTIILISLCEARGGRRGGSFGGLFGSWRKYKKPTSGGGSSRRIVSSSPVHTPITKAWHDSKKTNNDKFQKSFKPNNMYNGHNMPPLPPGGSYYQNTATLPGNAIYVAQAPPRGLEFGDFLTGYLTGRLLTMGFPSSHHRVEHIYRESPPVPENAVKSNTTSEFFNPNNQLDSSTIRAFVAPLEEFPTTTENIALLGEANTATQTSLNETAPIMPPYGVICLPMLVNVTNSFGDVVQNERTVCYPAPEPLPQKVPKPAPVEIAGDITEH